MRFSLALLLPIVSAAAFNHIRRQDSSATEDASLPDDSLTPATHPPCSDVCFDQARAQTSDCPNGDVACLCYQPEVQGFISSCLKASCPTSDLEIAAQWAINLCHATITNATSSAEAVEEPASTMSSAPKETSTELAEEPASVWPSESASGAWATSDLTDIAITGGTVSEPASSISLISDSIETASEASTTPPVTPLSTVPATSTVVVTPTSRPASTPSAIRSSAAGSAAPSSTGAAVLTARVGYKEIVLLAGVALLV